MKSHLALLITLAWAVTASAISIDTVPVGNVGNPNDPTSGYGGVSYAYRIGKCEVTISQYTTFLNAVATSDTYGLYSPEMATDLRSAGIAQSGPSGSYTYSVIGSPNRPITHVNWGDAARFANWLHNGQPTGVQNASTTEEGAYTLNGITSPTDLLTVARNAGAEWALPTVNEWNKAAYHQPATQGGDADDYWAYPMRTNSIPYSDQPPGAAPDNTRVGNFHKSDVLANGYDDGYAVTGSPFQNNNQNYLTEVGAYISAPSFYGTFDQGGNVSEWEERIVAPVFRALGGGDWASTYFGLAFSDDALPPQYETAGIGFRVVDIAVPEPKAAALVAFGVPILLMGRRKSVPHNRV